MIHYDFSGKVALVTGGTLRHRPRHRARVRARRRAGRPRRARRARRASGPCAALERDGAAALFVRTDVRDEAAVARAVEQRGRSASAGSTSRSTARASAATWRRSSAPTRRSGTTSWRSTRAASGWRCATRSRRCSRSGGGAIVNMSSIYGAAGQGGAPRVRRVEARGRRHDALGGARVRERAGSA